MSYTKYNDPWVDADAATGGGDESTPLVAAALDHIEAGIAAAIPDPGGESTNDALLWNGSEWVPDTIANANIAAAAAIAVSKLAPGSNGQILGTSAGTAAWQDNTITAVTALPSSPTDGQEVVLVDSLTAPTYQWRFRYNAGSSSSYKWEFVGGTPAVASVTAAETTSSTAYAALSGGDNGPNIVVPRAGDYIAQFSGESFNGSNAITHWIGLKRGAAATQDDDSSAQYVAALNASIAGHFRSIHVLGATASMDLHLYYKVTGGSATFRKRELRVTPMRVS